jgi:tight adherence protein C
VILLADLINFESIMPVAVFGMFAAVAWWTLNLIATRSGSVERRLDEFNDPKLRRNAASLSDAESNAVTKALKKASPALAKPLQPKTEAEAGKIKTRLVVAGFRGESVPSMFLSLKVAGLIAGLVLGGGISLALSGFTQGAMIRAVAVVGLMFYLPDVVLWFITRKRKQAIFLSLPDALDLMVVCVEAGLGLDQAMRKVSDEMSKTYPIISHEFSTANFQLQMGRPRSEVLKELGYRTGVDDVRALAAIIIQADKFGSSIANALRVQSDSMRTRRRQMAEEKAAKTAVKLIFPLVLFIFPAIFVVLVGPAAITMVRDMFPKMQGKG